LTSELVAESPELQNSGRYSCLVCRVKYRAVGDNCLVL
jgi:hypothetical protein